VARRTRAPPFVLVEQCVLLSMRTRTTVFQTLPALERLQRPQRRRRPRSPPLVSHGISVAVSDESIFPLSTRGSLSVGKGWTGPTECKDSVCVWKDEWWSQCQPVESSSSTTSTVTTSRRPRPTRTFTRPPITFPGTTTTNKPTPVPTGFAQLYDQCGGKTWTSTTRCAPGLVCVADNEYFSMCQKAK
jgi:hypothetical protein